MDVEIGGGCGISGWVRCRKDIYFHTLLYVCLCGAYKEKRLCQLGTQPPGNDATAASRCIPAQVPTSYVSAFIQVSHPLGSLCFPPPTVAFLQGL